MKRSKLLLNKSKIPLVSVIIVTFNREKEVLSCLESVLKNDYPNKEIILVDNASSDQTVAKVKKQFPSVKIVISKTNRGNSGGKNLGQPEAKGEFICFLDSDTVVDKKFLSEMVSSASIDPKIGLVCPKMYYFPGYEKSSSAYFERKRESSSASFDKKNIIWYAGASINLFTSQAKNRGCNEKDLGQYDKIMETDFAPTAYLATKEVVNKLKSHDETFFMAYNDSDYGYRVKEAGFKVIYCPTAKLWHRLGVEENIKSIRALGYNLPLRAYYFARNRIIFMYKHAPRLNFWIFFFMFFPLFTLYFSYKIIVFGGSQQFLKPHLKGSLDGIKFLFKKN